MDAFRGKAFEVSEDVKGTLLALEQDVAEGFKLNDLISNMDLKDSNLKEFLDHASETNITPTAEAYQDWATNVKGLGKQFDFAKVKAIALNTAMNMAVYAGTILHLVFYYIYITIVGMYLTLLCTHYIIVVYTGGDV